jgi:acetyltransferase-like isoleucine patch superfamily enzyme
MFRFLLNFIGFLLSFVFTEKIMHEVWHLRNVIYSSIVRCHFKSIGKGGRFCYPLILNGGKNILIGDKFSLRERGRIEAIDLYQGVNYTPSIIIGDNVTMGNDVHIGVIGQLKIGNNVLVGSHIFISDHSHGKLNKTDIKKVAIERRLYSKGNIIIEDNI